MIATSAMVAFRISSSSIAEFSITVRRGKDTEEMCYIELDR